jgi:hypothetical protein
MAITAFVGRPLATVPLAEVAVRSWPFDLVAPLAAWYWVSTEYRSEAESAFVRLQSLHFEATIACGGFDDVALKADGCLLGCAYHRALLEIIAPVHPQWQLQCNDLGQLYLSGSNVGHVQGQQFGMLAVFPDIQGLADHLNIDLAQLARCEWKTMRTAPTRYRPSLGPRR